MDAFIGPQEGGDHGLEEKTEEQIRMEKYIVENILDSDEESPEDDFLPTTAFKPWVIPPRRPALRALSIPLPVMSSSLPTRSQATPPSLYPYTTTSLPIPPYQSAPPPPPSPSLFRTFNPASLPLPSSSSRVRRSSRDQCGFCKRNGEIHTIYTSHRLTDSQGKVECPQLRMLVCTLCGATGDQAHTRNYCPSNTEPSRVALPTLLKSTPRQSDGRWRRRGGR